MSGFGSGSGFGLSNLPYGVFRRGGSPARCGVAFGEAILDLQAAAEQGLVHVPPEVFAQPSLNAFCSLGPAAWLRVRESVAAVLERGDGTLVAMSDVEMQMPVEAGDYVDFYSSMEHATNLGRMFRPDAEPLLPNWRHLPVGYHGRSGTLVVGGTPIVRPSGQRKLPDTRGPSFGPSMRLDFELEIGFITGPGTSLGESIPAGRADDHIFGVVLVNDWSARDIQAWEYQPLGPFLGKSFATSVSPWVVPLSALAPYRVPPPVQDPLPLPYLRRADDWALDLSLEVTLQPSGGEPVVISRTNARGLYWTMAQQLAHATSNGATVRPGDLFASGTISGEQPDSLGSMIELSWNGTRPLPVSGGTRTFLEDGDTVTFRGWCGTAANGPHAGFADFAGYVGFGELSGTILPARPLPL